jgi:hypothetical protein
MFSDAWIPCFADAWPAGRRWASIWTGKTPIAIALAAQTRS